MTNNDLVPGFDEEKDRSLNVTLHPLEGVNNGLTIILSGALDTYNAQFFQSRLNLISEAGFKNIIFNCSALNYVSSNGIGVFTNYIKGLKEKGGDMVLLCIQSKVYEVFSLLGFSNFFNIKDTIDEAIKFFTEEDNSESSIFPVTVVCPMCNAHLKAPRSGKFRCSSCKLAIVVDEHGEVSVNL